MKTSEIIEANNQLRVQLNTKNKNFYENGRLQEIT